MTTISVGLDDTTSETTTSERRSSVMLLPAAKSAVPVIVTRVPRCPDVGLMAEMPL